MANTNEGTSPTHNWTTLDDSFRDDLPKIMERLNRRQYTPEPPYKGVCGYPMPNGILIALNYRCTVCSAIRIVPVQGIIGVHVDHEPVSCLRCKQFSTVFSSVDIRSV